MAAHVEAEHPELEDGPVDLCQRGAEAVRLLGVGQLHVPQEPVLGGLGPGMCASALARRVHPVREPAHEEHTSLRTQLS